MSNISTTDVGNTINQYELQRCQALVNNDIDALGKLMSQDLVHVHANGHVEDKAGYLKTVAENLVFLSVKRASMNVATAGPDNSVAIATGELHQTIRVKATGQQIDMRVMTTQVWIKDPAGSEWLQILFQATNIV